MPKSFQLKRNLLFDSHSIAHDVNHWRGTELFATAHATEALMWRLDFSEPVAAYEHESSVYTVGCGENALATGSKDLAVRMFDYETQRLIWKIPTGLRCVLVEWIDPSLLAVAANTTDICIYDMTSGTLVRKLRGHTNRCYRVAWLDSSCLLGSVSYDNTAKLWDIAYDSCIATFEGHTRAIGCIVDIPRHHMICTGADDLLLKMWDKASTKCLATMRVHKGFIDSMEYLEEEDIVLSGCSNGLLVGVDLSIPSKVYQLNCSSRISGIEAVRGRSLVLTACFDGSVTAWEY
mmetsp:Transcript_31371/g.54438  ORF Transcript_31371/g.54438 Transcript_31371/m.54438 type:complete len:291 (-) Transcript_31371:58-930(-)